MSETNNHPRGKELLQVIELLTSTRDQIDAIMGHSDLSGLKVGLLNAIQQPLARVKGLMGIYESVGVQTALQDPGPVTEMFGKPIQQRTGPIAQGAASPAPNDLDAFRVRRDEIYNRFLDMSSDDIMELMIEPQGVALVRSVAKKAELADYREAKLDGQYIQRIRDGITAINEVNGQVAGADAAAAAALEQGTGDTTGTDEDDIPTQQRAGVDDAPPPATSIPATPITAPPTASRDQDGPKPAAGAAAAAPKPKKK